MPFYREYDPEEEAFFVNRNRTGPPNPTPSTGTGVDAEGNVVHHTADGLKIPLPTPVPVSLPGPNEKVIDSRGVMTPRWYRFLSQLYRRTGGPIDNINRLPIIYLVAGGPDALAITGAAPSVEIDHFKTPSTASVTITGAAPTIP